mmetsp:Transcript_14774/g.26813  ORF Transcript_14774/g.26813 Transcript_14774/m.26813 type:complete len:217 (-) Transcript_14774:216-866(-)|eukprot:CAMPEP_0198294792 /NCGR_PEP_ID=MMETSP1449-20131203/24392_1 /TAXON_ID=420275 /ORGANISM="Attheya septentrionalis, Strain CCMP2084" /LENGTH=216 /DNA_ID=CAMNT_0043994865 /DNA_START=55 /DNA_END=705 /DNA_ORIENTATION=+
MKKSLFLFIGRIMKYSLFLFIGVSVSTSWAKKYYRDSSEELELPRTNKGVHCETNAVAESWCDQGVNPALECFLFPEFDEYVCSCHDDSALCPDDCVGGSSPHAKNHHSTQCLGIPVDQPNYILVEEQHEFETATHCAENGVVTSWCDESVDPNLECVMFKEANQYACRCPGHHSAECPVDCIGGTKPVLRTHSLTHCEGIPLDQPNYILKSKLRA